MLRRGPSQHTARAGWWRAALPALLLVGIGSPAAAQGTGEERTVRLRSYEAGSVHRLFLGSLNREAWSIPVRAPELDLERFAGGLTPVRRGGGLQTRSLRFQSGEGPVYTFRSIEKDATRNLDPQLRGSLAAAVLQDQIGALFPLSAMVVAPLLEAAGVLHARPVLVVLPDSPRLGEFREDFAGLAGWIEVRPDEGPDGEPAFAGADRVTGTPRMLERLEEGPEHRMDAEAFLRARLMDLYVGDWDRHPDQWRWAAFEGSSGSTRWFPVPRDRDWALNRIDGVFWSLVRRSIPQYVSFGPEFGSVFGTVWNGRALDRHLLSELERSDWERVSRELRGALTDDVIRGAVAGLPSEYRAHGQQLEAALRSRRDALPEAADRYYRILAERVDVFATDERESARLARGPGGTVHLEIRATDGSAEYVVFERTFHPEETRGVRVYLRGGDDTAVVEGPAGPIWIRVVGGGGDDHYTDRSTGERTGFYDDRGDNVFEPAPATTIETADYEEPEDTESETHQARARDWGSRWLTYPLMGANRDVGAFLGQSLWWNRYGFRRFPYEQRVELTWVLNPVNFGFQAGARWRVNLSHERTREWITELEATSREVRYFHGIGNSSALAGDAEFHRADRAWERVQTGIAFRGERIGLEVGGVLRHSRPVRSEEPRLVQEAEPGGFGSAWQADGFVGLELDGRDHPSAPTRGFLAAAALHATPAALDIGTAYGRVTADARVYVSGGPFVLVGYASGARALGEAPWYDLPTLGGVASLRGFRQDRFIDGGATLVGTELRFPVTPFFVLFPGTLGLSAFAEAGRVFGDRDTGSESWHTSYGGGAWASLVSPEYTVHTTVARSIEGTRMYFGLGFAR